MKTIYWKALERPHPYYIVLLNIIRHVQTPIRKFMIFNKKIIYVFMIYIRKMLFPHIFMIFPHQKYGNVKNSRENSHPNLIFLHHLVRKHQIGCGNNTVLYIMIYYILINKYIFDKNEKCTFPFSLIIKLMKRLIYMLNHTLMISNK